MNLNKHIGLLETIAKKEDTNVYSTGIDIASVSLFEDFLNQESQSFFEKYFTKNELGGLKKNLLDKSSKKNITERAMKLAARYAAKEAFVKAIDGKRLFQQKKFSYNYQEVELLNDSSGRPYLKISGQCKNYLQSINISSTQVSLSHEENISIALVILFKK